MTLLLAMIPIYLLGNAHCLSMCGPLVALLGRHPQKNWYFAGRVSSFTLFGLFAGAFSESIQVIFRDSGFSALVSFFLGLFLVCLGFKGLTGAAFSFPRWAKRASALLEYRLARLLTHHFRHTTFLFGFFTLALPCGQSLMVLSTSALLGSAFLGAINAFFFAILTTPSLFLAMETHRRLFAWKDRIEKGVALWTIGVGCLGIWHGWIEWQ